ncbi:MAG: glycosyltransferase family 4 protein [Rhodospirillales bacterium]|nr:glycosyltransferase family 4 protein [Rhodospirillales bacterium]
MIAAQDSETPSLAPLRVLCLDIEGGHGGSSRSLFESVRHTDPGTARVEVWCRRDGPVQERYAALGVPCRVTPDMPKVSALPRLSRNLIVHAGFVRDFVRASGFRSELAREVAARFDVVHFNHEALWLLARWLRSRTAKPLTMHIRTNLWDTPFARRQVRTIAHCVDHVVFISENERATHRRLGAPGRGTVIHNIATLPDTEPEPHPAIPDDGRFKIASLSNTSWLRGTDRLVHVAAALAARGRRDVLFVVAGDVALGRSMPGALGSLARRGGTLKDYAMAEGVGDMVLFLGHAREPERVLAACDALAKPTRENNPWGRDIIEAMAMGKPVFSVGIDATFVETGETGVLQPAFDADDLADRIIALAGDREACRKLGDRGRERVARLCNGPRRAADLVAVWRQAVAERREKQAEAAGS